MHVDWEGSVWCSPVPMFSGPYVLRFMILVPMFPMFPSSYVPRNVSQSHCPPTLHYPVTVFPSPYVPQSLCSPHYDISPYVPHVPQTLCYPEMFPSPVAPQPYITQSLCSPVPMIPSPYVPQSLWSPVHLFPSPYRCSPVPMLPSRHVPLTNSPVHMFTTPIPQKLLFPIFPKHVPHSLCSPNYFTSCSVRQSVSSLAIHTMSIFWIYTNYAAMHSSVHFHEDWRGLFLNLGWYPLGEICSYPKDIDWVTQGLVNWYRGTQGLGTSGLGNIFGEHRDWEAKGLWNTETGKHRAYLVGGRKGLGDIGTGEYRVGEHRDWEHRDWWTKGLWKIGTGEHRYAPDWDPIIWV